MFKKSPKTKQLNLFTSPSRLMCERESRMYDDESAWHNKFYKKVTSKVDEDIFKHLYTTERKDNRVGRPNASICILVSMMILKEECARSDEQLYEQRRFNLLYRRALGMMNLDEQCPTIDSYYGFRRKICEYEEKNGTESISNAKIGSLFPLAKLLKGVKKAHDSGKYLLEESEKRSETVSENGERPRFFRTKDGVAYGFTVGGKVYINPRVANSETPIHENSHLWATAMQKGNPKEWKNIVKLMKGTSVWDEVKKTYPELESDSDIADEVLAHYSNWRKL